jgi:hypothetical protein
MPDDVMGDLEDDEWPVRSARPGVSVRRPTAVLLVLLVAAGAFWGGAAVQRSQTSPASSLASSFASRFRALAGGTAGGGSGSASGFGGGAGFGGAGGFGAGAASTAAATGTITVVDGNTLYVTEAGGTIVEVNVGSSTKVTRDAPTSAAALHPGDSVVVQGSKSKTGAVDATSVAATAASTAHQGSGSSTG